MTGSQLLFLLALLSHMLVHFNHGSHQKVHCVQAHCQYWCVQYSKSTGESRKSVFLLFFHQVAVPNTNAFQNGSCQEVLNMHPQRGFWLIKGPGKEEKKDLVCGLYYKNKTIMKDTSRVVISDAPSCGVTYDCHSDNSRGVIYAPREHVQYRHHL